ncbi:alpha-amylase family protein [Tenggerimyces flavus]|uniref:Beta-galactosidase n=1 Tax=Tenggerimyces flavus TaxID=1708749 RepID=A0ABV7YCA2_9ACTN|nr:alpha-amylase family protein [Tenggerimyces flavus]MBM7783710.1 hypothetical protein [Tenggerimyces flavus]
MSADVLPWYRRTLRWGQTNLTEVDPTRYDSAFWRAHWRKTRVQGVIVNAGGIVAYYPSANPLHHRATGLGDRDLYGDVVRDAREEGLTVVARMDSNRATEDFYRAHPDWFAHDADGHPYRAGERYVACVNSPYYDEYLLEILREIVERSHPDGFADNSWTGLGAAQICYCANCASSFGDLPRAVDYDDPTYRAWLRWNEQRRTEVWRQNNVVTTEAGGPHCLWVGMISGDQAAMAGRFVNVREIAKQARIFFVDHQRRNDRDGFAHNADVGARLHGLVGWDVLLPESMAMYSGGHGYFRATSMPVAEVVTWAASGFAGGIQPWWHHISAFHEDRRQYATAEPIFRWHEKNERYLVDRTPLAQVGVVWSEQNVRFHGRADADNLGVAPYRGVVAALQRARIPYLPVHVDDLRTADVRTIVLPDLAMLSDEQCATIGALVDRGVSVVATGSTSLKDEDGQPREDFGLDDVLGVSLAGEATGSAAPLVFRIDDYSRHDYLRFQPGTTLGFDDTAILPLGGRLERVAVRDAEIVATYVEPFPAYPPELAWLRPEPTSIPVLTTRTASSGARIAYSAADLDRTAGRDARADHLRLLGELVRWTVDAPALLEVDGEGRLDCRLYAQAEGLVLNLVSVGSYDPIPGTHDELVPVGPFDVRIRHEQLTAGSTVRALVSEQDLPAEIVNGALTVTVPKIIGHEVLAVATA